MPNGRQRTPGGVGREAQVRQAEAMERLADAIEQQNELLDELSSTLARGDL